MLKRSLTIVLLVGLPAGAAGQTPAGMHDALQSTLESAQAAAQRPGDESLGCDALEGELVAAAKDPAFQSYIAKTGAVAKERLAALNAASGRLAGPSALTLFSSIVPGGAWAGLGADIARGEAQKVEAARYMEQQMQLAQEMMRFMPQIMRGQRVIELAQARQCAWLREGAPR